ncbi:hypothetical protein [Streptomyces sannanensis]
MTVELDGIGRQLSDPATLGLPTDRPMGSVEGTTTTVAPVADPGPDGSEGPVFVDTSGRRQRKLRRLGWFFGFAFACYGIVLVATLLGGNSSAPWLLIPGESDDKKAGTVKVSSDPTAPASPSVTKDGGPIPGAGSPLPTDSRGSTVPSPAGSGSADGSAPLGPGASATSPKPKPSGGTVVPPPDPVGSPTQPATGGPDPEPSSPNPTDTAPEPSSDPTAPSGESA